MKSITLGILETGKPPQEYAEQYGSYPDMFKKLLVTEKHEEQLLLSVKYFHLLDDTTPTDPTLCDAWLITGSKYGAYEQHDWIPGLTTLIRNAYEKDIPMVGICFGHQIIAQALGGSVVKSDKGWSLGVNEYHMASLPQWLKKPLNSFSIQAYHQDQVVALPENTSVLAQSEFCPFAALNFNNRAISFQGHPEFGADYTAKLLTSRRDLNLLPVALTNEALSRIDQPLDSQQVAQWIIDFLNFKLIK